MTAACHRFPPDAYGPLLESETEHFITAVSESEWDGPVPACPGWTVAGLIEHVGGLHRWAEAHVRLLSQRPVRAGELDLQTPENLAAAASWLRAGVSQLVQTLRAADPDATVWAWGSDKRTRFWGRRMLFETTVHRADIELARGRAPQIDLAVAVDGVDEFLEQPASRSLFRSEGARPTWSRRADISARPGRRNRMDDPVDARRLHLGPLLRRWREQCDRSRGG